MKVDRLAKTRMLARAALGCAAAALVLASPAGATEIYRYIDKQGRTHFTDQPPHPGYKQLVRTWKGWREPTYNARDFRLNQRRFAPLIAEAARAQDLPDELVHAVITAESAYDPEALSSAGAVGLMQLMPATARRFGVGNRTDPRANVFGGTRYLKELLVLFDGDMPLALAAYNAGENAVLRHNRSIPPYPETRQYVNKVLDYYRKYRNEGLPVAGG